MICLFLSHTVSIDGHANTKAKEQKGSQVVCIGSRDEIGNSVSKGSRENRHNCESRKSGGEDEESRMFHGHDGGDEEGFVTDFRDHDHCKRKDERLSFLSAEVDTAQLV